jgi:hypothetical protein
VFFVVIDNRWQYLTSDAIMKYENRARLLRDRYRLVKFLESGVQETGAKGLT